MTRLVGKTSMASSVVDQGWFHARRPATSPGRRQILQAGLAGFSSLSLGGLLRERAARAAVAGTATAEKTAIILVWLRGGCSHLDTFDPKPQAASEFRGPFSPVQTAVPGIQVTELLPRIAAIADRWSLLRSIAHSGGGHPAGSLQMLAGDPASQDKLKPVFPDWMSIAAWARRDPKRKIPGYVAVNPVDRYDSFTIAGPTYLGPSWEPFKVTGDPSRPDFEVPNNVDLRQALDRLRSDLDHSGMMQAVDDCEAQALNLLLSPGAAEAFDLSREKDSVRDRYGRNQWGQQCLMARRLVEAGVDVVTTEFDGPLCGRVANWDDHAVNHHVFDALAYRAPFFDQAVSALIEDIFDRGLDQRVLVVVGGEFGRTPRISYVASSGGGVASAPAGTVQPGRDHWPRAGSILFAGGGIRGGQVIGATNAQGTDPIRRRVSPSDYLATLYQHLGIDWRNLAVPDFSGRPIPILNEGQPISELLRG